MFQHKTVLGPQAVEALQVIPNGIYVDCTLGGGGHSELIATQLSPQGWLIGIDQDINALEHAQKRLSPVKAKLSLVHGNFRDIGLIIKQLGAGQVDGILYDLGVSSPQLDQAERGFSYQHDAPLDMRMDQSQTFTAYELVNTYSEDQLADIFFRFGEERFSKRIAKNIVQRRESGPITSTGELAELIRLSIPAKARQKGPHPAKRTFQAIRIAVNNELGAFTESLEQGISLLKQGGRVAVMTFHSLEDRICKQFFKKQSDPCTCPICLNVFVAGNLFKVVTKKPIIPDQEEVEKNPRARSAKLRVAQKI